VGSHLISVMTAAWQRLVGSSARNGVLHDPEQSRVASVRSVKVRELAWQAGEAAVWPVEWVDWADPGGAADVPETGVLEGFTRLGNRLLLRINVNGSRRTAGLEWDAPPSVDDVEAVLQANLGAQIGAIGQLEVPIRARPGPSA
jgi:hypothetical protein